MYEKFFHLEKPPFSTVPDPNCVHLVGQHADAVSGLVYGVMSRKGYLVLTGEAGLGKTTALGAMANLLGNGNVQLSMILNPILTAPEFIEMVMLNFGFANVPSSKAQRLKLLQEFLVRSDQEGKVSALIVDEAHKLSADLLEEIRLLGNFEAPDHKLLQIVLVGQDELDDRLNLPELWQLKQRMVVRMSLRRLEGNAVERYLKFRWNKAGGSDPMPFTGAAIMAIATWSHGIPRLINAICDNALLLAFSQTSTTVDVAHIQEACVELRLSTPSTQSRPGPPPARPAAASRPAPQRGPVSTQGEGQFEGPQFWQYSGPSLLEKWRPLTETEGETTKKAESPGRDFKATTATTVADVIEPAPAHAVKAATVDALARSLPFTNHAATNEEDQRSISARPAAPDSYLAFPPAEIPPMQSPAFGAFEQERPVRVLRPIVPIAGVIVLAGAALFFLVGRKPSAPTEHIPVTAKARLGMEVKRQDRGLLDIQWNPHNPDVAQAVAAKLVITEGEQQPRTFELDPNQLQTGHLSYPFAGERGEFRLEVVNHSGVAATESVFAYVSNTPVLPQLAAQAVPQTPATAPKQQTPVIPPAPNPAAQPKPVVTPAQPLPVAQPKPVVTPAQPTPVVQPIAVASQTPPPVAQTKPVVTPAEPNPSIAEPPASVAPEAAPVASSTAVRPPTTATPASAPSPPPTPRTAIADPVPRPATAPSPLVGSWDITRAATTGSSFKPASVTITISERNGQIEGTLTGNYQVPTTANFKPEVALSFSGAANGAQRYPFTTRDGMRGTIELIRTTRNANLMEVVWIPEGQPLKFDDVFLKRQ